MKRWLPVLGLAASGLAVRRYLSARAEIDLAGRSALVTGGSRGLGLLIARELVRQGCRVAILARDRDELERAQASLEEAGGQVIALSCDLADAERTTEAVHTAAGHFAGLDLLFNNAGIIQVGPLEAMNPGDFRRAQDIMFWGVLNPTLAALPLMRERRFGRIVNITSIGGKVAAPHILPYATAKFATVGLSEGMRAELAKDGIAVTTVVPGLMRTGSYLNAEFKGRQRAEFAWFALAASLPGISMDAERAARRIVLAARRGESEVTLTVLAIAGSRLHGLFPGITADALGWANRLLPRVSGPTRSETGKQVLDGVDSGLVRAVAARVTPQGVNQMESGNGRSHALGKGSGRG